MRLYFTHVNQANPPWLRECEIHEERIKIGTEGRGWSEYPSTKCPNKYQLPLEIWS